MKSDTDLFVYGTLMAGQRNHVHLAGCRFLGPARARGQLLDLGAFPGLVRRREAWASGEVYRVPADRLKETLARLDRLEGYSGDRDNADNLFVRSRVQLEQFCGSRIATTYFFAREHRGPDITSGSWRARHVALTGDPLLDALAQIRVDVDVLPDDVVFAFNPAGPGRIQWRGAELCIRDGVPKHPPKHPFGGPADYGDVDIVSPHAHALAWLVCRLRDEVWLHIAVDKYTFFGTIGFAALGHHAMYGWSSARATLTAVLSAARCLGRGSSAPWPLDATNRETLS